MQKKLGNKKYIYTKAIVTRTVGTYDFVRTDFMKIKEKSFNFSNLSDPCRQCWGTGSFPFLMQVSSGLK